MSEDIVDRLRDRSFAHKVRDPLVEEAADEIERLRNGALESRETVQRCPHIRGVTTHYCSLNFTLADEEREAVEWYASYGKGDHAQTLRALLERTK